METSARAVFLVLAALPAARADLDGRPRVCGAAADMGAYERCGGEAGFSRGDVDGDGLHDATDAVRLLLAIFAGGGPLPCEESADVNDDGRLDVSDAAALLDYLFRGGPVLAEPFYDCGPDPTPDELGCRSYPLCE